MYRTGKPNQLISMIIAAGIIIFAAGCASPAPEPGPEEKQGKHDYKDLSAETVEFPAGLKEALPGLQGDRIYMYKEVAPTANLLSYEKDYEREKALTMMAKAFTTLTDTPELRENIEFWIIQVQPPADSGEESRLVVWGARPGEADAYKKDEDLKKFVRTSEYLMVDDRIIPKGDARLAEFPGLFQQNTSEEAPEDTIPPDGKPR